MSLVGREIADYALLERIGYGGMGAVYLGRHQHTGQLAAIKVLHARYAKQKDPVRRFFNEARAVQRVNHDSIVDIRESGTHELIGPYLVMEHLQGEDLKKRLKRVGSLPLEQVTGIVVQVSTALQAAHECGIIHRDLKPSNIFLVDDEDAVGAQRIKVLDFGVAKLHERTTETNPGTEPGAVLGTPTYIAPEQCRGAKYIDHRADVYSLGVIAYHALCGQPPFKAELPTVLLAMQVRDQPPAPRSLNPEISPEVEGVLLRALEKEPADRFANMDALRLAFLAAASGHALPGFTRRAERETAVAAAPLVAASDLAVTRPRARLTVAGRRRALHAAKRAAAPMADAGDDTPIEFVPIVEGTPMISLPRIAAPRAKKRQVFLHAATVKQPKHVVRQLLPMGTAVKLEPIDVDMASIHLKAGVGSRVATPLQEASPAPLMAHKPDPWPAPAGSPAENIFTRFESAQRRTESVIAGIGLNARPVGPDLRSRVEPLPEPPARMADEDERTEWSPPPSVPPSQQDPAPEIVELDELLSDDELDELLLEDDSGEVLTGEVSVAGEAAVASQSPSEHISYLRDQAVRGGLAGRLVGVAALLVGVAVLSLVLATGPADDPFAVFDGPGIMAAAGAHLLDSGEADAPPLEALPETVDFGEAEGFDLAPLVVERKKSAAHGREPATASPKMVSFTSSKRARPVDPATLKERARERYRDGMRALAANNNRKAMSALYEAVKLDPAYADPHRALGSLYVRRGDVAAMCVSFKHYVRLAPRAYDATRIRLEMEKYAGTTKACRL